VRDSDVIMKERRRRRGERGKRRERGRRGERERGFGGAVGFLGRKFLFGISFGSHFVDTLTVVFDTSEKKGENL